MNLNLLLLGDQVVDASRVMSDHATADRDWSHISVSNTSVGNPCKGTHAHAITPGSDFLLPLANNLVPWEAIC